MAGLFSATPTSPELTAGQVSVGGVAAPSSPQEYASYLEAEQAKWGKIVKAIGLKID